MVGFSKASFLWDSSASETPSFQLRDLNLNFPVGKLSLVVGPGQYFPISPSDTRANLIFVVGAGKSALLMSLLGETTQVTGRKFLPSPLVRDLTADPSILTNTTAYSAQTPWLLSATVKDNILFGSNFNEHRYKAVVEACALNPDLEQWERGDQTEVGERGIVVSGGQKARISLARAWVILLHSISWQHTEKSSSSRVYSSAKVCPLVYQSVLCFHSTTTSADFTIGWHCVSRGQSDRPSSIGELLPSTHYERPYLYPGDSLSRVTLTLCILYCHLEWWEGYWSWPPDNGNSIRGAKWKFRVKINHSSVTVPNTVPNKQSFTKDVDSKNTIKSKISFSTATPARSNQETSLSTIFRRHWGHTLVLPYPMCLHCSFYDWDWFVWAILVCTALVNLTNHWKQVAHWHFGFGQPHSKPANSDLRWSTCLTSHMGLSITPAHPGS